MMILFVGGSVDGDIHEVHLPNDKKEIRVGVNDTVEFYAVDPESFEVAHHRRGIAHFVRQGESADSLVDVEIGHA